MTSQRAILCSGHLVDAPTRKIPRFPASLEGRVADEIRARLDELGVLPGDVAICGGARGTDILFAEAALARGIPLRVYLAFEEEKFIESSVALAASDWVARFRAVLRRSEVFVAPRELGPLAGDEDPYERANEWMLREAQRIAGSDVVLICVWDGNPGDGPGGTKHMKDVVEKVGGTVRWIDIRTL
jgi:hypothetical protein